MKVRTRLPSQQSGRPDRQREQQEPERHRRAPRTGRRRSTVKLSTMPSSIAPISVPGRLPSPPSTQIANTRPIYSRPIDGSTGWITIRSAPAIARGRDRDRERDALDARRRGRHQLQRKLVLRHRHDGAARESVRARKSCKRAEQRERDQAGHQHAQRQVDHADVQARPDIGRFDIAVVDAEHEDERHLGDEQEAEEEREPAQRLLAVAARTRGSRPDRPARRAHRTPAATTMLARIGSMPSRVLTI